MLHSAYHYSTAKYRSNVDPLYSPRFGSRQRNRRLSEAFLDICSRVRVWYTSATSYFGFYKVPSSFSTWRVRVPTTSYVLRKLYNSSPFGEKKSRYVRTLVWQHNPKKAKYDPYLLNDTKRYRKCVGGDNQATRTGVWKVQKAKMPRHMGYESNVGLLSPKRFLWLRAKHIASSSTWSNSNSALGDFSLLFKFSAMLHVRTSFCVVLSSIGPQQSCFLV